MMTLRTFFAGLLLFTLFFLVACEHDTAAKPDEQEDNIVRIGTIDLASDAVIATIADTGGCAWGGVCPTYKLRLNGVIEVLEPDLNDSDSQDMKTVAIRRVKPAEVETLVREISKMDYGLLTASFSEGSCQGCVDGIDTYVALSVGDERFEADTVKYNLIKSENVFSRAMQMVYQAPPGLPEPFNHADIAPTDVIARISFQGGRASAFYAYDIKRNGDVDVMEIGTNTWPRQTYTKVADLKVSSTQSEALLNLIATTDYVDTFESFTPGKSRTPTDGNDTFIRLLPDTANIGTNSAAHAYHENDNVFAAADKLGRELSARYWQQR